MGLDVVGEACHSLRLFQQPGQVGPSEMAQRESQ